MGVETAIAGMGALSSLGGSSTSGSQNGTETSVHKQDKEYDNLLGRATDIFNTGGFYDSQYAGGADTYAGFSGEQNQQYQALMDQAQSSAQSQLDQYSGAYDPSNRVGLQGGLQSLENMSQRDLGRTLGAMGGDAAMAGQSGSTRAGIAQGLAAESSSEALANAQASMLLQDQQGYEAGQQRAIGLAGDLQNQAMRAGQMEQASRQGGLDDMLREWEYESGLDLSNLSAYKGLIGGDMGGTTTSESTSKQETGGKF
tara:strand:- start:265 stop:1032 length:768 start_codon:yes stop_codon:yes gene_type:complete